MIDSQLMNEIRESADKGKTSLHESEVCKLLQEERESKNALAADAARYQWLRAGNAYTPEESHVRGGDGLDALCDKGISWSKENNR